MNKTSESNSIKTKSLWAVAVLAGLGLSISIWMTHQYYQLRNGSAGFTSFCNLSQTMNCDLVAASRFAELVAGLPLSSFAAGWYLAMAVLALMSFIDDWRRDGVKYLFWMACFSAVMSIVYFFIMASVIKSFCLFCLVIDGINFGLVGLLFFMRPRGTEGSSEPGRWKTVAGVIAGSIFVAVVLSKSMDTYTIDATTAGQMAESTLNSPVLAIAAGDEFPSFGPKDAPVTIVEFSDFQCPYCKVGAFTLNTVQSRYPTQVRVVFRNFPLDPSCNPLIQTKGHSAACEAAKVTLCARKQDKFEPVYQQLFEKQESLNPGKPTEIAHGLGLDAGQLAACVASQETATAITRDIEEAKRLDVKSTPTFFINGRKVEGAYPAPIWNMIIDRLLAEKK